MLLALPAIALVLAGPLPAISSEGYGESRWGMSRSRVEKLYPGGTRTETGWVVASSVAGKQAVLTFEFADDVLVTALVGFSDRLPHGGAYADEHASMRTLLTKKYGSPAFDNENWSDGSDFLKSRGERGLAITTGHLDLATGWALSDSRVTLGCSASDSEVSLIVFYESVSLLEKAQAAREKRKLKDL